MQPLAFIILVFVGVLALVALVIVWVLALVALVIGSLYKCKEKLNDRVGLFLAVVALTAGSVAVGCEVGTDKAHRYPSNGSYQAVQDCELDAKNDVFRCVLKEKGEDNEALYVVVKTVDKPEVKKDGIVKLECETNGWCKVARE